MKLHTPTYTHANANWLPLSRLLASLRSATIIPLFRILSGWLVITYWSIIYSLYYIHTNAHTYTPTHCTCMHVCIVHAHIHLHYTHLHRGLLPQWSKALPYNSIVFLCSDLSTVFLKLWKAITPMQFLVLMGFGSHDNFLFAWKQWKRKPAKPSCL